MKILIVANGYPTEKYKGNGIFEFDQAKALAATGNKVIYIAVDLRSLRRWRQFGFEQFTKDGVEVYAINIPLGSVPQYILSFFGLLGLRFAFKKVVQEQGLPDVIHAHFTSQAYLATKFFHKYSIPVVVTEHSSLINSTNIPKHVFKMASYAYSHANQLIAVSNPLSDKIERVFSIKPIVIPNIVDINTFVHPPINKGELFTFVTAGSLIKGKRMDLLIKAFYKFSQKHNEIRLIIFGDGPERSSLEALIKDLRLSEYVTMKGMCKREEISVVFREAHCFVLASASETFGVVYAEALAAGLPVIATKCGGPEDFVHKNNGLLIDVDSKDGLVFAMIHMYESIGIYDRNRISQEICELFSPNCIANKLCDIYQNIGVIKA